MIIIESNLTKRDFLGDKIISLILTKSNDEPYTKEELINNGIVEDENLVIKDERYNAFSLKSKGIHIELSLEKVQEMIKENNDLMLSLFDENKIIEKNYFNYNKSFKTKIIGIKDGDFVGIVQSLIRLVSDKKFENIISFSFKNEKTNEFFVLEKELNLKTLYLSADELKDLYLKFKEELYALTLTDSLSNFNELNHSFHSNYHIDEIAIKDELTVLRKLKPFYHNKINMLVNESNKHLMNLNYLFYEDYLMPFLRVFPLSYYYSNTHEMYLDENDLNKVIKATNPLEMFKIAYPKGNKRTIELLDNVLNQDNDLGSFERRHYEEIGLMNSNIINLFENTERLNQFLELIMSCQSEYGNVNLYKGGEDELNFFKNILPTMFTSRVKYENNMVKFLEQRLKEIEADLQKQDEDFYAGLEALDCDCGDDDYCECESDYYSDNDIFGGNNFNDIEELLCDTYKSYQILINKYDNQNDKMKSIIDNVLSKKYTSIEDIHNEFADIVTQLSTEKTIFEKPSYLKEESFIKNENIELSFVDNNFTLKRVGREMHHCVASYEGNILDKTTSIITLKEDDKFVVCLELDNKNKTIRQAKGKYNSMVSDRKHLNIIKSFSQLNDLKIVTSDLNSIR